MLKLIIADDEIWVRTTIKSIIPFEKLGLALSGEAANGIEALELCRLHKPDILLTDIRMPGLTGLELISEVRNIFPNLKIAIISGYGDFEYAKTAMKYGITDYLLKPVDENELEHVLSRLCREISEMKRLNEEKAANEERYREALPVMCESFLNRLIAQNSMTSENMKTGLRKFGIDFGDSVFSICVSAPDTAPNPDDCRDVAEYCGKIIKRVMRRCVKAVSFPLEQDRTTIVSIINGQVDKESINKAFRLINLLLARRQYFSISMGISGSARHAAMLPELYRNASEALEARFYSGAGTLMRHEQISNYGDLKINLSDDILNKIVLNIKLSNIGTAVSYFEGISGMIGHNVRPSLVKEFFWQSIQSIITLLNIQVPFIRHETTVTGEHPYDRIRRTPFLDSLVGAARDILQRVFDFYHAKNPQVAENLVEKAKMIIDGDFAGDISLEQVARQVHLSPAYLSELFKRKTGMSFIDYKTVVRIENAKKLLMVPSASIYEVSKKVGYSDPKYFSKLFKRITGKTVYEYKKENRR